MRARSTLPLTLGLCLLAILLGGSAQDRDPLVVNLEVTPLPGRSGSGPHAVRIRAELRHAFSDEIESDLRSGIPTVFRYQLRVHRVRKAWRDPEIARMDLYRSAKFALLEKQYRMDAWIDGSEPETVGRTTDPDVMKRFLTRLECELPFRDPGEEPGDLYYVSVRTVLKAGKLPRTIKGMLFFIAWDLKTPWRESHYFRLGEESMEEPRD